MADACRHRPPHTGTARGAACRHAGARVPAPIPRPRPRAATLPPFYGAPGPCRATTTPCRASWRVAAHADAASDGGAVASLAARVAATPPSKRRDRALKKLAKAVKALREALEEEEDSSGSESDGGALAATPMTAASARTLAFSLAGAARRAAGEPAPLSVGDSPAPAPVLAAVAGALRPPPPSATPPPALEVCTGPRCARLGSASVAAALAADYEGGVTPCACTGECGGAVAGEAWFEARWEAGDEGEALERRLASLV